LEEFKSGRKLLLGICNGFQVLAKSGILFDEELQGHDPPATLTRNDSGKFEDRWVHLRTASAKCVFFAGIDQMYLPVAHAEGKFVVRETAFLDDLERSGRVVLRYASCPAAADVSYPSNPNGSLGNVAGVCDSSGNICGLMPHPERHIDPTQHPRW